MNTNNYDVVIETMRIKQVELTKSWHDPSYCYTIKPFLPFSVLDVCYIRIWFYTNSSHGTNITAHAAHNWPIFFVSKNMETTKHPTEFIEQQKIASPLSIPFAYTLKHILPLVWHELEHWEQVIQIL